MRLISVLIIIVPKMRIGEQCSSWCFLYYDNQHELGFEIGSGTKEIRNQLQAEKR